MPQVETCGKFAKPAQAGCPTSSLSEVVFSPRRAKKQPPKEEKYHAAAG
jgi:hypothetical protein